MGPNGKALGRGPPPAPSGGFPPKPEELRHFPRQTGRAAGIPPGTATSHEPGLTRSAVLLSAVLLSACVPTKLPVVSDLIANVSRPAMRWDHRPEATEWTDRTIVALAKHDDVLAGAVPADIRNWCPAYEGNGLPERRAFWAGLLSAVAKYESSWNPKASGGGGRYIGVMQISPKSAANHGCAATSAKALKDGAANLECAVEMLAYQVARDGVVAGKGNRGIGRDWMPLRKAAKRGEMAAWTAAQSYCQ